MLWCGAGRLSDRALRLPADLFVTLQRGHAFPWSRSLRVCVGADGSTPPRRGELRSDPHPVLNRDAGFVTTDWAHLDRVSTVAASLSRAAQRDITRRAPLHAERRYSIKGEPVCSALFTGNWGVSGRRLSTSTMHCRASSTAAAAKRRSDAGEEHGNNKEDERESKETTATSSLTEKAPEELEPEGGKPSKSQQLKKVFKEYGAVGVCFHIGISLMSLGMFYLLISSGIDMAAVLCKLGFSEAVVRSKMAAGTSTFVLAYAIHKLFAPVRISITLVSVPLIVRYFRKTGLFKPPTPAP